MNKSYRLIWSDSAGTYVAVQETAKGRKKSKSVVAAAIAATVLCGALGMSGNALAYVAGNGATAANSNSTVIGDNASSGATTCANMNVGAQAPAGYTNQLESTFTCATVIGKGASSDVAATTVIGEGATSTGTFSTAVGTLATAGKYSQAFGAGATASGDHATALGQSAYATKSDATAVGTNAWATGARSASLGSGARAMADDAFALGWGSVASGVGSTAIGISTKTPAAYAFGMGYQAAANSDSAIAMGKTASVGANSARGVAIGSGAAVAAASDDGLALGSSASAGALQATAVGAKTAASKLNATALGYSANASGEGAVATGANAIASAQDSVAVGSGSVADRAGMNGATEKFSRAAVASKKGAVSVGSAGNERQITNVAGGTQATDAVNVRQLQAVSDSAVKYDTNPDGTNNYTSVTLNPGGDAVTITNVADGDLSQDSTDAVNGSQLYETNTNVTNLTNTVNNFAGDQSDAYVMNNGTGIKYVRTNDEGLTEDDAHAQAAGSSAVGYKATASAADSLALGRESVAGVQGGVAIGSFSVANTAAGVAGFVPAGANAATSAAINATTSTLGAVSVGDAANGQFRQITGVAAGTADSDAVNVAQLKGAASAATADAVMYDNSTHTSVTLNPGGDAVTITNVADGDLSQDSTDAVNGSQLYETNTNVTNLTNTVNNFAGDQSDAYVTNNGTGIKYVRTNDEGLTEDDAHAQAAGSSAVGYKATASAADSLALGRESVAGVQGGVAIGSFSVANTAAGVTGFVPNAANAAQSAAINATTSTLGAVSVGDAANGQFRQITGVAAGTADSDAVNVAQLKGVASAAAAATDNAVLYDNSTHTSVTLNPGGEAVTVTNVKEGDLSATSTDAVNGSQLWQTNQNVTNLTNTVSNLGDQFNNLGGQVTNLGNQVTNLGDQISNLDGIKYVRTNDEGLAKSDAFAQGQGSTAVGYNATTTANAVNSVAMGANSVADAANSVAMGSGAAVTVANSVALGAGSVAGKAAAPVTNATVGNMTYGGFAGSAPTGVVSVGAQGAERQVTNVAAGQITATSTDAVNGSQLYSVADGLNKKIDNSLQYDSTTDANGSTVPGDGSDITLKGENGTQIHNVADGVAPSDAATVGQVNQAVSGINNRVNALGDRIETVNKDANAGSAGAMAMANMPQAALPGKSMLSAGVAAYQGQAAMAMGVSKLSENGRWIVKLSGSVNTRGNVGVGGGVGFHW